MDEAANVLGFGNTLAFTIGKKKFYMADNFNPVYDGDYWPTDWHRMLMVVHGIESKEKMMTSIMLLLLEYFSGFRSIDLVSLDRQWVNRVHVYGYPLNRLNYIAYQRIGHTGISWVEAWVTSIAYLLLRDTPELVISALRELIIRIAQDYGKIFLRPEEMGELEKIYGVPINELAEMIGIGSGCHHDGPTGRPELWRDLTCRVIP